MIKVRILKESKLLTEAAPTKDEAIATLSSNKFKRILYKRLETDESKYGYGIDPYSRSTQQMADDIIYTVANYSVAGVGEREGGLAIMWIKNNLIEDTMDGAMFRNVYKFYKQNPKFVVMIKDSLIKYFAANNSMPSFIPKEYRDIMNIKSFSELVRISDESYKKKAEYEYKKKADIVDVGNFNGYSIKIANNKKAACELGKDTNWCTSHKDLPFYEQYYNEKSPIFIVQSLNNPADLYQIGFLQRQFEKTKQQVMSQQEFEQVLIAFKESGVADKYPEITKTEQWKTGKL